MTEAVVQDWLNDWASLDPGQVQSFITVLDNNEDVIVAIHTVVEERAKYAELQDLVCDQLFSFYRSREVQLQRFTLQFLPTLTYTYLASVAAGDRKSCKSIETLLLGMYNLEIVTETGEPVVLSFRLPSLAQGSIYHEPTRETITESALRRYEEVNTKPITWGPFNQIEVLNAQNRLRVLTALLFVFNRHIGVLHRSALKYLCKSACKIVTQGFPRPGHHQRTSSLGGETNYLPRLPPRIQVNCQFLLELCSGLYYAIYNDFGYMATQAIEDIHHRSCFECFSDAIIVTNAMKNSANISTTGETEKTMGISVALSPATTTVTTVNKSMITNASFRTKKLPDDLEPLEFPTVTEDEPTPESGQKRSSRRRIWQNFLQTTPEVAEGSPKSTEARARRRSEIGNIPPYLGEETHRPVGSDSPKRRALVSRTNVAKNSPNRVSAGARLYSAITDEDDFR